MHTTRSVYDAMQIQNCKPFNYRNKEMYPSIRPPVSPCSPDLTAQWLADTLEDNGCERAFDMENDDIVEVWKRSPKKDSLRFYGIGSAIPKPEAIVFNQLISKCLAKVNHPKPKTVKSKTIPPENEDYPEWASGNYVLNRQKLQSKLDRMPTVREVLDASNALNWLYCPFIQTQSKVSLRNALGMERPGPKPKHGLRHKHKYCELPCGIPENKCTEFEWSKGREDTKAYQEAYNIEMERLEKECEAVQNNYDELYSDLITCFEKDSKKDPFSDAYKCCMKACKHGGVGGSEGDDKGAGKDVGGDVQLGGDGEDGEAGKDNDKDDGKGKGKEEGKGNGEAKGTDEGDKGIGAGGDSGKGKGGGSGKGAGGGTKKGAGGGTKKGAGGDSGKAKDDTPVESDKKQDGHEDSNIQEDSNKHDQPSTIVVPPKTEKNKDSVGDDKSRKDCPCEICEFMTRRAREPDSPLIAQMKKEQKRRELKDYYKQMCHREYLKCRQPEYRAPQHKCDPIVCDNCFCRNPKLGEYCDCLDALQELQKLLAPKQNNEIILDINDLKDRICRRLCECM